MIISFVVLCYNQKDEIITALNSIYNSNIPTNEYEVIVIDDCSTDDSISSIEYFSNKFNNYKKIYIDKNTGNRGGNRNIGIDNSSGKYIMFLDGDDYFNSNSLYSIYKEIKDKTFDIAMMSMSISNNGDIEYEHANMIYERMGSHCDYIINREYLNMYNIRNVLDDAYAINGGEGRVFMTKCLDSVRTIYKLDFIDPVYCYQDCHNIVHTKERNIELYTYLLKYVNNNTRLLNYILNKRNKIIKGRD